MIRRKPKFERLLGKEEVILTQRDHRIFQYLDRYRLLTSDQLRRLAGGGSQGFIRRLQRLYHSGFVERPQAQRDYFFRQQCRAMIYALSPKSARLLHHLGLREKGLLASQKDLRPFFLRHAIFLSEIMTRIECDGRNSVDVGVLSCSLEQTTFETPGKPRRRIIPDAVVVLKIQAGCEQVCVLVEADCGTEPVQRKRGRQSSIGLKIEAYYSLWKQGAWVEQFHTRRFRVLILTRSKNRTGNILRHIGKHFPKRGSGLFVVMSETSFFEPGNVLGKILGIPSGSFV